MFVFNKHKYDRKVGTTMKGRIKNKYITTKFLLIKTFIYEMHIE